MQYEDCILYSVPVDDEEVNIPRHNSYIGWAANDLLLKPQKKEYVLIDHYNYNIQNTDLVKKQKALENDKTNYVIEACIEYYQPKLISVKQFCTGGVRELSSFDFNDDEGYIRSSALPYTEAVNMYNQAQIFFVTHPESLGLSVLEASMAGALIVTPKGYINKGLTKDLVVVEYENKIPFDEVEFVLDNFNPVYISSFANQFNYLNWVEKFLYIIRDRRLCN